LKQLTILAVTFNKSLIPETSPLVPYITQAGRFGFKLAKQVLLGLGASSSDRVVDTGIRYDIESGRSVLMGCAEPNIKLEKKSSSVMSGQIAHAGMAVKRDLIRYGIRNCWSK